MHVQGQEVKEGRKLEYRSIAGRVYCVAEHCWRKQVLLRVTGRKMARFGYPTGYEFIVQEGNPWARIR